MNTTFQFAALASTTPGYVIQPECSPQETKAKLITKLFSLDPQKDQKQIEDIMSQLGSNRYKTIKLSERDAENFRTELDKIQKEKLRLTDTLAEAQSGLGEDTKSEKQLISLLLREKNIRKALGPGFYRPPQELIATVTDRSNSLVKDMITSEREIRTNPNPEARQKAEIDLVISTRNLKLYERLAKSIGGN